jgi:hypothetical protein
MSSPTRRGVTQNPREADQGLRRSARISKKQPGGHARRPEGRQSKRCISSKDIKMPKIIKSASSTEEQKWDILHNPNKDNPAVTKSHEDIHADVTEQLIPSTDSESFLKLLRRFYNTSLQLALDLRSMNQLLAKYLHQVSSQMTLRSPRLQQSLMLMTFSLSI